jgi:hypothetical protein
MIQHLLGTGRHVARVIGKYELFLFGLSTTPLFSRRHALRSREAEHTVASSIDSGHGILTFIRPEARLPKYQVEVLWPIMSLIMLRHLSTSSGNPLLMRSISRIPLITGQEQQRRTDHISNLKIKISTFFSSCGRCPPCRMDSSSISPALFALAGIMTSFEKVGVRLLFL